VNPWTIVSQSDGGILRWRRCINDSVIKLQQWTTHGDRALVTLDISESDLRAIVAALREPK
jgi:hypothetical protein